MSDSFDLQSARRNAGHSIRSLASELGLAPETVRRVEAGESVHPANAKKVADFFSVKVTDLAPAERTAA
jgi:ribosome-binding protein aMBF1 (putative translation factor)